jgi:hypothetical protein
MASKFFMEFSFGGGCILSTARLGNTCEIFSATDMFACSMNSSMSLLL